MRISIDDTDNINVSQTGECNHIFLLGALETIQAEIQQWATHQQLSESEDTNGSD